MALDSTIEEVPESPSNARRFGRHRGGRGASAFPQLRGVYLVECGTHAICDAQFVPYRTAERTAGLTLLRSVSASMLLLWDRGFHSYGLVQRCRQQGAHVLGRLPRRLRVHPVRRLADGTLLATLPAPPSQRNGRAPALPVRVLEYTLTDPGRPGYGVVHRLLTSLLDETAYPALLLIQAYHQRWELELTIDEVDTHQRWPQQPLRSRTPQGVLQELYGLLLAHYAIRRVMAEAAQQAGLAPTRLSFVKTLRQLQRALVEFQLLDPTEHARWYQCLLDQVGRACLPVRSNRSNPRVVKRKMSKFKFKRKVHRRWPQPATSFHQAIVMLN
jgi:hypothetical protein